MKKKINKNQNHNELIKLESARSNSAPPNIFLFELWHVETKSLEVKK